MPKRIVSTLVLWAVVIGAIWVLRTPGAVLLIGLVAALTLRELYRLLASAGFGPFSGLGIFFGTLATVSPWFEARLGSHVHTQALPALVTVIVCVRILGEREPERRVEALMATVFGVVYVGVLLQYLVRIATPLAGDAISADGRLVLCLWVVAVAKFCDVGALLCGLAIGRRPLAPQISPKKTWEGVAGGVLASMGVGALIARLAHGVLPPGMTPLHSALIAAPVGAIGVVSDLVESVIKRRAALKDSGGAIPGIGGIFDLSDSLLLAAPTAYFLLHLP